jgi:predicted dehydrogenase
MRWAVGEIREVIAARATGDMLGEWGVCDCVIADVDFEGDCLGRVFVSLGAVRPYSIDLSIYGTAGTIMNNRVCSSPGSEEFETIDVDYRREHPYFREELDDLIEAVETDRDPFVTALDAARTVAACEAIIRAIASGESVTVEEV